ncbi:hypothetical protein [Streptomyces sp. NBC_00306]|uniref:hypothetical protein n=1 Tax=Streptomyces sp. NBC_00306 TaxID=2975708 RepID=UPI002E2997FC|nr:hypothetical protein [Streptomyces sp. NBC_00306]
MSEVTGTAKVHEAYAFCCMRCGHGWEQSYEIEHHVDGAGQEFIVYKADGVRVPSPLSSPTCTNCGGHVVRIMRSGQVSSVLDLMARPAAPRPAKSARPARKASAEGDGVQQPDSTVVHQAASPEKPAHHWHLSDLLHPFHRK